MIILRTGNSAHLCLIISLKASVNFKGSIIAGNIKGSDFLYNKKYNENKGRKRKT